MICKTCSIFQKQGNKNRQFQLHPSSETQGFKGNGKGRERKGARKKGDGRGGERKEERGSPGKLLYTDHFSIEKQTPLARCETEALV